MNNKVMILLEKDAVQISLILHDFLRETDAKTCLVIDKGGHPIAIEGDSTTLDTTSISALAAGAFASTKEIARLVGETEFTVLFHQGEKGHIHVSHVDTDTLLIAIFNNNTTVGLVRHWSQEAERKIAKVMEESRTGNREEKMAGKAFDLNIAGELFNPAEAK